MPAEDHYKSPQRVSFLIVGMARSGTTVAQRLVSEFESVWVPQETHFWRHGGAIASRFPVPLDRREASDAISWFLSLESSVRLAVRPSEVVDHLGEKSYLWDLFEALVMSLSPPNAVHLGEKTPDHARWAVQLLRALPGLSLIGLVRDPREAYRSHLSVPWGIKEPWSFAEKWVEHVRILEDAWRIFGDRVTIVRYEDLVEDPDGFRSKAADLLGIEDRRHSIEEALEAGAELFGRDEWWKKAALGPVGPVEDRWRGEVDGESISIIEWRAWDEMQRWTYEPVSTGSHLSLPASSQLFSVRRDGGRAAVAPLPITERQLDRWQQSEPRRLDRWRHRAEELVAEREEQRRLYDERLGASKLQVRRLSESASSWKRRAEDLNRERGELEARVHSELIRRLEAEKGRLDAIGKLRRLRARRWWRLGGVIGKWRRSPYRVDLLFRGLWQVATSKASLPSMPDVAPIEARLIGLRSQNQKVIGADSKGLAEARARFRSGDYEGCLAVLASFPADIESSPAVQLLKRDCYIRLGEVSQALTSVRVALAANDDPSLRRQSRILAGRLRETDLNWLPDVGLSRRAEYSAGPGSVLHILKESLPFFERGYTMRSQMTLIAQRQAGFDPTVVTSLGFPRNQGFEHFPAEESIEGIVHHRLDLGPTYRTREIPYDQILSDQAMLTARLCDRVKPAVIQAGSGYRGYETALVGLAVARHLSVPMIYEIRSFLEHTWTPDFERSEEGEYYRRRHDQETRCLDESDFVITIAEAMRQEIIERGIPAEKIEVVPNVVDVDRFQPRPKDKRLAREYGLLGRFTLGYISNLGAREGIDNLIRAVHVLRGRGLDVAGLVVGDGPERETLEALVAELGLEGHFALTGHVSNHQIEDHYALIDLFVVPRIDDRAARLVTPLKPLEAMAMEIPVVASDLPALRELVTPDRGRLFASGEPESIADTVEELRSSDSVRSRLAANARKWILEERTVDANAARYRTILERVLGGG